MPDLFLHGHETLFLTPLVCLASAVVLAELLYGRGLRRIVAISILAGLTVMGLAAQWRFFLDQMHNAL